MNLQKVKPRNPKLIKEFREEIDGCERCGSQFCMEMAHITSKGAGGPDIRENLLKLCGPAKMAMGCHGAAHKGKITQKELYELVGRREGLTGEECRRRTRRAMGYDV